MLNDTNFNDMLDIGIALTKEKSYDKLLSLIISISMDITSSDAGTLYLYENDTLNFKIMKNCTLGVNQGENGEIVLLPPVQMNPGNACAYSAINREIVNIPDVYNCDEFDFSGPKEYDCITGYKTRSMLVVPLENHENELIGVVQLLNSHDKNGNIVPYQKDDEYVIMSIASQAAISVSNMQYTQAIKSLMHSIVSVFTTAVDARTPYNANHTKNVAEYVEILINYINQQHDEGKLDFYFDDDKKEQLTLATMLHDIGKLVIPIEIMNKETRLGSKYDTIINRMDYLIALFQIDFLEKRINKERWMREKNYIINAKEQIKQINTKPYLTEEDLEYVYDMSQKTYPSIDGKFISYITADEKECLMITKGTLTDQEREIMKTHVTFTERFLQQLKLNKNYNSLATWAACHHEYLDGTGYPNQLKGDQIPFEARILVVVDIFEALTSTDRPYKKSIPKSKAFSILHYMALEGKIDMQIVKLFEQAITQYYQQHEGDNNDLFTYNSDKK